MYLKDFSFLLEAKKKLSLPKHIETIVPLNAAIAYLEGKNDEPLLANTFNNPIDWICGQEYFQRPNSLDIDN